MPKGHGERNPRLQANSVRDKPTVSWRELFSGLNAYCKVNRHWDPPTCPNTILGFLGVWSSHCILIGTDWRNRYCEPDFKESIKFASPVNKMLRLTPVSICIPTAVGSNQGIIGHPNRLSLATISLIILGSLRPCFVSSSFLSCSFDGIRLLPD